MEKVCINDFSPGELKSWMMKFYPNGLNRIELEKYSNMAKIKAAKAKIDLFQKNEFFEFNNAERNQFKTEVVKLKRLVSKYEDAESDFVIARGWDKKRVLKNLNEDDALTMKLLISLNNINFETEILKLKDYK